MFERKTKNVRMAVIFVESGKPRDLEFRPSPQHTLSSGRQLRPNKSFVLLSQRDYTASLFHNIHFIRMNKSSIYCIFISQYSFHTYE